MAKIGSDPQLNLLEKLQPSHSAEMTLLQKDGGNCFCTIKLGPTTLKVILYFTEGNPLCPLLQKRCRDTDYDCCLAYSEKQVVENCSNSRHPALVVVDTEQESIAGISCLEHLSRTLQSKGLQDNVKILPIVKSYSSLLKQDIPHGVSRVLTTDDCRGDQFLLALKLWERNEASQQKEIMLGHVFFEAVDQSNDAVQITGPESNIIYVNRAFADLSGYSRDEVLGKPAMDILKAFDHKTDNGPRLAATKVQSWDGVCLGRRKSGSVLKQHIKLIPIRTNEEHSQVNYHVTIQRLLSSHELDHPRVPNSRSYSSGAGDRPFLGTRQPSLGSIPNLGSRLEIPITKVVQVLSTARDNTGTPPDVKEALERAMEILCSAELFSPGRQGGSTKGIVDGLLQSGRRFSVTAPDTMRTVSHPHSHFTRNPPITPPPPEVQDAIQNIDEWEFDIINVENLSGFKPLYYIGMKVFKTFDLCDILDVEESVVASWLKLMEIHYHRRNAYHNSTHAADVLQATAYFIKILQDNLVAQGDMLERMEIAALLITAVIHDLDHPGRTNPYLCNTRHELAMLYNDSAVLENHHVALGFKLTQQSKETNIYQNLDSGTYRSLRSSIIDLVLATDMAKHFEHLAKFNMYSVDGDTGSSTSLTSKDTRENRMVMKRILVKCADISNPCRPTELCKAWAQRIAEEYFSQTEDEKHSKLPVIFPDFDRHTCKLPVTQVKFIDFFISGLFDAWHNFCPIPLVMDYLKTNYELWTSASPDSPSIED